MYSNLSDAVPRALAKLTQMDELEAERRRLNAMNRSLQDPGTPGTPENREKRAGPWGKYINFLGHG